MDEQEEGKQAVRQLVDGTYIVNYLVNAKN